MITLRHSPLSNSIYGRDPEVDFLPSAFNTPIMKHLLPFFTLSVIFYACVPAPGYQEYARNNSGLPDSSAPDKCYVRTVTLDEYEIQTEDYLTYTVEEAAKYPHRTETLILKPEYSQWETTAYEGCESPNPNDCQVLCYRTYEAQTAMVYHPVDTSLGKPIYKEYEFEKVIARGGLSAYEEIDCALTNYAILPLFYKNGSAALSETSRKIIADELLSLLREHPNFRIQVNAHTSSIGSSASNQALSERRAATIADYLVSRGVNRGRIVTKGYGESQLLNRCADGVDCSEAEHLENKRIEFRVLNIDSK